MPTTRRRRTRHYIDPVSAAVIYVLRYGELPRRQDPEWFLAFQRRHAWITARYQGGRCALRTDWETVRAALLEDWIDQSPGRRPWFWWEAEAPDPRRRVGGIGDLFTNRPALHLGMPEPTSFVWQWHVDLYNGRTLRPDERCAWTAEWREGHFTKTPVDPANPPIYESQAAYLGRHGLLVAVERLRLTLADFEPEALDVTREDDAA